MWCVRHAVHGERCVRRSAGDWSAMRVRTALRSSSTNYSIAAPCVHLAAHALSCVCRRAVRFDAQLGGASGGVRLVRPHTTLRATVHAGAVLQSRDICLTRRDRCRYSGCGTQKKKTAGPTSGCSAKLSRRCRTSRRWRETGAAKPRDSRCALCLPVGDASFGGGIGVTLGEGDMANRLRFIAGCFPSIFLISGLTDARAADPGFCRQFAKAAISQVRGALADPRCGAGVQGARWSTDFAAHYEWCLGASPAAAGADRDARTRVLRACTSR